MGHSEDTVRVQLGYSEGTVGYSEDTVGHSEDTLGHSEDTVRVQLG